ncbi:MULTISPECIES: hypothetical protein [unclassified Rhizobium]|nr:MULTISPECIES: hypothetical protein [unclassified Rhizobium]
MTVKASFTYREGKRAENVSQADWPIQPRDGEFIWIDLVDPTPEEMEN